MKTTLLSILLLTTSLPLTARSPDDLQDILRETRIVADVLNSALRQELRKDLRVTQLDAQYLAAQGGLVSVKLNSPWLKFDERGEPEFEFHGNISLPEIPAMVNDILNELEINMSPYEPETLEDLRELREEQKQLRMDIRESRSVLRTKRRELVRTASNESHKRDTLEEEIQRLQDELKLLEEQNGALSDEIDSQYNALKDVPAAPQPARAPAPPEPVVLDDVLAQAVCDYGATLKSLPDGQFLTLAVHRGKSTAYYAFRMDHVKTCNRGGRVDVLLDRAYQYQG